MWFLVVYICIIIRLFFLVEQSVKNSLSCQRVIYANWNEDFTKSQTACCGKSVILSISSAARSVENVWVTWQDQNKCEIVSSSCLQYVHTEESHILHRNNYLFVGIMLCSSRSWNHVSCVSMVLCLLFKNMFPSTAVVQLSVLFPIAVGMISDLISIDSTHLFSFCVIVHNFVPTI